MTILSVLSFILFILLMGNLVVNIPLFLITLVLGSLGLASILTMVAAIASRASNNFSLMAILSFPIVLPLLGTLMKVSKSALSAGQWSGNYGFIVILLTINVVVIILAYLLFPYLWTRLSHLRLDDLRFTIELFDLRFTSHALRIKTYTHQLPPPSWGRGSGGGVLCTSHFRLDLGGGV